MASPSMSMEEPNEKNSEGGWIGIDLGTSNCTAAVWDLSRSRCKVLRLGHDELARPPAADGGGSRKGGKIVPSAVLFHDDSAGNRANDVSEQCGVPGVSPLVGYAAIQSFNETNDREKSKALVTSFKRVVGMTSKQAKQLESSDPEFWNSLPFQSVIMDTNRSDAENEERKQQPPKKDSQDDDDDDFYDMLGDTAVDITRSRSSNQSKMQDHVEEGVAIRIRPLDGTRPNKPSEHLVAPLQLTTILLRSIRVAASDYLVNNNKPNIQAPGMRESSPIRNCVIGVPAQYSHAQRTAIRIAARNAGFAGYVGIMTESTAAAMAYGLFVSPGVPPSSKEGASDDDNDDDGGKNILVFDMGGGTTDVTIASLNFGKSDKVQFRVVATAGDRCLGGDDVDELLARHLWKRHASASTPEGIWKASEHRELTSRCRRAKEELCGNDAGDGDAAGMAETHVALGGKEIRITRLEFDSAIRPLIDRAERVVDDALSALESHPRSRRVHEVVLVGGSTHVPTIRSMLRRKFPPPVPPELCTSISAETAVAQGLAIQAALVSGVVPLWELRNAMMLDVLPHSVGVWVGGRDGGESGDGGGSDGGEFAKGQMMRPGGGARFVSILPKDAPLPAMGSVPFYLAAADQSGITVVAAERIGPGEVYQSMGTFDFLLHRPGEEGSGGRSARRVEVGMTLAVSGEFVVSVFDESDPEHRDKRRRYLKEKASHDGEDNNIPEGEMGTFYEEEEGRLAFSGMEIGLLMFCVVLFSFYVAARVAFNDVEIPLVNDEL